MSPGRTLLEALALLCVVVLLGLGSFKVQHQGPYFQAYSAARDLGLKTLSLEQGQAHFEARDAIFVDARSKVAFDYAHIPRALSLPSDSELSTELVEGLKRTKLVIVYCDNENCGAAARVAQKLTESGLTEVVVLDQGWDGWLDLGLPSSRKN